MAQRTSLPFLVAWGWFLVGFAMVPKCFAQNARIGHFEIDVTIPMNHRCMGILPQKSKSVTDSLQLHGFVLLGHGQPIVVVALDWCEIRNQSYDQWRSRLAEIANTTMERVLISSLHQHDAPVIDEGAQNLLDQVGLHGELYDRSFHEDVLVRAQGALALAIDEAKPLTHIGYSEAMVNQVASNRRVVDPSGRVTFGRGSSSGRDLYLSQAEEGLVDPWLRTISFWNESECLVEYHAYATHPMSYYGRGEVTSDFVGLARKQLARMDPAIHPIYASGCSGDVTAGKYNDGSPQARLDLTTKILNAMTKNRAAELKSKRSASWTFRSYPLSLEYSKDPSLQKEVLERELNNPALSTEKRILAAMGLASWKRAVVDKQPIDMPCIDFGAVRVILFPGESFVGYQRLAQQVSQGVPVIPIGYGECWTGYIPTESAFGDGFNESWLWVAPGAQERIDKVLRQLLPNPTENP